MSLLNILVIAFIFCVLFGAFGHGRYGPAPSWSPAGIVVAVLLVL
ncbi:MAG TPA: hypothetical protein VGO53_16215 [Steroidobacteraceae bacterium]|jgi:hypothetical protein|nr:hypothetical protein [Steroidobacteraceae bacterium]